MGERFSDSFEKRSLKEFANLVESHSGLNFWVASFPAKVLYEMEKRQHQLTQRLVWATWALFAATVGLLLVTAVLAYITLSTL